MALIQRLRKEEECIDLVVVEEDEDQLHLSSDDETLHDRETSTPVSVSSDDNIVDAGNSKNKPRNLDNRRKRTWVKKVQDTPSNRKIATRTKKKTANETCPKVVWVSNVSHNTSASELQDALSAHGNVIGAKVVVSARYPGSSCYGYVTMASNEDVDNVIAKLNNTELNGQIIKLGKKLNDNIKTRTRSKDASKIQGKETVTERGLRQNLSIERSSSMGKSRPRESSYYSNERFKHRQSRSPCRKSGILTFAHIKEERERQKMREQERALREASRRRQEEIARQKDIDRRQREEAMRLKREKEKLRIEKEKIVREREELIKLEEERYKIAQEKIELEKTLSHLEEGRIKRPAPHWVNGRKRFATGNRHFEAAAPPRKNHSASTWSLYGSSKNNCGKIRPYDGENCYDEKSQNYDGLSRPSSSKYDRKPNDCQDRTLPHMPKQNSGNAKERNVHNMYKEFNRNTDLHYNKTKSRLFGSSKPFQTSVIPNWPATFDKSNWRPTPVQNDRWVSGNPHQHQLHPYSNMPSNLNTQYAPQARTTNYYNEKRVGNAKSVGCSNRKF